jgi:sortase B
MKKKFYLKKLVTIFLILILLGVFIFSIFKIFNYYHDINKNNKENKKLINDVIRVVEDENNESGVKTIVDFSKLLERNKDTKGWIRYNNEKINYPVVQSKNNEYYLTRDFYKKYNQAGSIFMDYRNNSFDDKNVVLYGHSMLDNSMFGSLQDIFKTNFFDKEENNIIELRDLDNNILKYQIFSYYIIEKEEYYITTSFKNDKEYLTFLNTLKNRSYKDFNINLDANDKTLTLSTCSGVEGTTKRKVVHAKRI